MTIDLTELFKVQNVLKERIAYKKTDRFSKTKLALLVEIGECANEWRGFKYWSKDQEPRLVECEDCGGDKVKGLYDDEECFCENAKYPLLEEYVDGLHFVMQIGLEIHSDCRVPFSRLTFSRDVTEKFNAVYHLTATLSEVDLLLNDHKYKLLLTEYVELADYLGFTWGQVEAAYYEKNAINHKRQESGY